MALIAEPAAPPLPVTKQRVKVQLVPWDPEDEDHVQRLYRQRVACGWKQDKIETWKTLQREGKIAMHWVVSGVGPFPTSKGMVPRLFSSKWNILIICSGNIF
jgi:hypothetical protein